MRNYNCLVIAEVAQAHDGSLGMAHAYIDAVSKTGADIIKFQTHIASEETTISEPWRIKFSKQDSCRYDYWKRMEFSDEQWLGLKQHADDVGIKFISSPFSMKAVELLRSLDVYAWKVASGEVNNNEMLSAIAKTGKDVYLSTGMSTIKEIDHSVEIMRNYNIPFTLLQCTSIYPTPAEKVGLNMLDYFRNRYNCRVGLSDHSGKIYPGIAAAALGASVLEMHVTFSKEMFGPDVSSSLTLDELKLLVDGVRFIEHTMGEKVDKNIIADELQDIRNIFRKSIVYLNNLKKGSTITREDVGFKKPGTGINPDKLNTVLGNILNKDVLADSLINIDDFK